VSFAVSLPLQGIQRQAAFLRLVETGIEFVGAGYVITSKKILAQ
jgi:hypothetical protein